MFIRFRPTGRRLQLSLVETQRVSRRVRHLHLASLGSVPLAPSSADRIAFWAALHQRLARLANRIDAAAQGALLAAVHARIPMPTPEEQHAVQCERARANAKFWHSIADGYADDLAGHKELLASEQRAVAEREAQAADSAAKAEAAKDRLARVESGEAVPVPPPLTRKDMLRIAGMTEAEAKYCQRVAEIAERGEDWWRLLLDERERQRRLAEKRVTRKLHRRSSIGAGEGK